LTSSPKRTFLPSTPAGRFTSGRFAVILVLISLLAAIPRLLLGVSQYIEYDGYWHVFIAQQDNWQNFWADIYANAHPPLYFLILKAALWLGHSLLVYRSVSLLAGIASVFLVGWIARKVTASNLLSSECALAYGLALPGIIVSCEVRSYMLSVFFVLLSFACLLKIPGAQTKREETKARAGFALWAIFACLSHYFAFYYSGTAMLLLAGSYVARRYKNERANWMAEAITMAPLAATIGTLYFVHAGRLAQIQSHLLPYYFDPQGHETATAFLLRNWTNFLNLFSPWKMSSGFAVAILIVVLIGGVFSLISLRRTKDAAATRASWTLLITALMLLEIAASAVAGKYPFGGDLRQQYLLFPFLVLCLAIFIERVVPPGRFAATERLALNTAAIIAILWVSTARYEAYPKVQRNVAADPMQVFDRLEPTPAAVYVDQFNLITFFIYHHTWDWTFVNLPNPIPGIDAYRLRRGNEQMFVFRDKTRWNADPDDTALYPELAACLRAEKPAELSVFAPRQTPPKPPFSDLRLVRSEIVTSATSSAVCVQRLAVNQNGWYATFRQSKCATLDVPIVQVRGKFDNASPDIQYAGLWSNGSFPAAANGTVSYSNIPGAVARLSFEGTEITYVYTKAFNRGIAEVKLDGVTRGDIDLYSPTIQWQSQTAFRNLTPGKHTFELTVAGRKDRAAQDQYVDVDALVVR
jgi:hypothetical protein